MEGGLPLVASIKPEPFVGHAQRCGVEADGRLDVFHCQDDVVKGFDGEGGFGAHLGLGVFGLGAL